MLEILKHEPALSIPVPIEQICKKLDIVEIKPVTTPGFEGALFTYADKHSGVILFNQASRQKRRRFTIAHELRHFLAPSHLPDAEGRFLCSQADMLLLATNEQSRRQRMEVEANQFASLILLPPPIFRWDVDQYRDPDIRQIIDLSDRGQVSLEAIGRAYVSYRSDLVAVVITQNGRVLLSYRDSRRFPFITASNGSPVPQQSVLQRRAHQRGEPSETDETDAGVWIDVERGIRAPNLSEQVYVQAEGFATILLTLESSEEEDDPDAGKTAKERLRDHRSRYAS